MCPQNVHPKHLLSAGFNSISGLDGAGQLTDLPLVETGKSEAKLRAFYPI